MHRQLTTAPSQCVGF